MTATIAICVPTRGHGTLPQFTSSLCNLVMYSTETLVNEGVAELGVIFGANTYIDKGRDEIAAGALSNEVSHLLWLDDDMSFPKDALLQMLRHDRDIVGANYPTRKLPIVPTAIKSVAQPPEKCFSNPDESTGLEPVDALGFGCVLVKATVFNGIYPRPWFRQFWDEAETCWVGEDVDFCRRAREAGFEVFVDHDLSKHVIHHGMFEYHNIHTMLKVPDGAGDVQ